MHVRTAASKWDKVSVGAANFIQCGSLNESYNFEWIKHCIENCTHY